MESDDIGGYRQGMRSFSTSEALPDRSDVVTTREHDHQLMIEECEEGELLWENGGHLRKALFFSSVMSWRDIRHSKGEVPGGHLL